MPDTQLAVQVTLKDYNVEMRALAHRNSDGVWRVDKIERISYGQWVNSQPQVQGRSFVPVMNRDVLMNKRKEAVYWASWEKVVAHHVALYLERVGEA